MSILLLVGCAGNAFKYTGGTIQEVQSGRYRGDGGPSFQYHYYWKSLKPVGFVADSLRLPDGTLMKPNSVGINYQNKTRWKGDTMVLDVSVPKTVAMAGGKMIYYGHTKKNRLLTLTTNTPDTLPKILLP